MPVGFPTEKLDRFGNNLRLQIKLPRCEVDLIEQISVDHGLTLSAAGRMLIREALLAREAT